MSYRINEHHSFILKSQELGQETEVTFELLEQAIDFRRFNFNYETFGSLDALSGNDKVTMEK